LHHDVVMPLSADRAARDTPVVSTDALGGMRRGARLAALSPAVGEQVARARKAVAFARAGRHAAAERLLREVAGALMRREALEPCARVQIDLGRLLLSRGRVSDARRAFADAAQGGRAARVDTLVSDASLWEAGALIDAGSLDDADAIASSVLAAPHALARHRAWAGACLVRVALWRNDVASALARLPSREAHDDAVVNGWIEATAVRALVAAGHLFAAGRRAAEARRLVAGDAVEALAIVEGARLRVLSEAGDLDAAAACLALVAQHARAARTPLVLARAQLVWATALRRAGCAREADALVMRLRRVLPAAPPLLRQAIEQVSGGGPSGSGPTVQERVRAARPARAEPDPLPELVGTSRALHDLRRAIVRAAAAPFAVLIEGESGVGKELVARAIHRLGPRAAGRFCDVNCAALPDELVEAELFGHARGAYTGAIGERAGLFEAASGGTLFLDEVSELSPRAQAKLLRVIQQQEVRRLGETVSRPIDVRIVGAANRGLSAEAAAGRFRTDLLYRLEVIHLRVPSLRDRPDDVPVLAECFWRAAAARVASRAVLSDALLGALARYEWPGNVRELQNVMAALAVAAPRAGRVPVSLLPARIVVAHEPAPTLAALRTACERQAVTVALARAGGRRAEAARALGLTRQGLLKLLARLARRGDGGGET
jgi:DNA-binding NtrC family response regulator